ncbi:LOB domain-containing protein 21 [Ziziphus jujuba]|uniref:LOB domain-containing protein 21 n=1 Tax=Ziziphus jujuba TaxID=326968 RepID=A0A6P3ZVB4_ZIZJJ|nr:LOB domain-containing protein 21 [Ziziphus jujuba]
MDEEVIVLGMVDAMKGGGHRARSSTSCAACKFLKRRCIPNCIFAPYFRSDEPKKFAKVHKVFGASNVSKILNEVAEEQREDAVNSLAYEAEARLRDPVYGCIGAIAMLQRKMVELQNDLALARARLAARCATNISSFSSSSSSSSYTIFDDRLTGTSLSGMQSAAYNGFTDSLSCYSSSTNLTESIPHGLMYDYSYVPYIL